jgi:hypothetical protein
MVVSLPSHDHLRCNNIHILIGIFRDISAVETSTLQEKPPRRKNRPKSRAKSSLKNMRTVQEIAQLLGESTAETKVALNKLKDAIKKAGDDE